MIQEWHSSIAQPSLADWLTVSAYIMAALITARAAGQARVRGHQRECFYWRMITALLILLGINEILDLQTLITAAGRSHAKAHGWYAERQTVQAMFVAALITGAILAGAGILLLMKGTHGAVRLAMAGLAFIGVFVLLRAASFHHLERVMAGGFPSFTFGSIQEVTGIGLIAIAALLYVRAPAPDPS